MKILAKILTTGPRLDMARITMGTSVCDNTVQRQLSGAPLC